MGNTILTSVCAISAMCTSYTTPNDRSTGVSTQVLTIVEGASYQFLLSDDSYNIAGNLYAIGFTSNSLYSCAAMSRPFSCTPSLNGQTTLIAGPNGTMSESWRSNSWNGANPDLYRYSWLFVAPVPSQPKIAWSMDGVSPTEYILKSSQFSTVYGSNISACLLAFAPSALLYGGTDFPASWPRDNATFAFVPIMTEVMTRVWLNPTENAIFSGQWDELTTSTEFHDYFFACYNDAGQSIQHQILSFRSKSAPQSAPVIHSVDTYSAGETTLQVDMTFQDLNQFLGFDDIKECYVSCQGCDDNGWSIPADGSNNTVTFYYNGYMQYLPVVFSLYCGDRGYEHMALPVLGYIHGLPQSPSASCELGYCSGVEVVDGANVTIISTGGSVGSIVSFVMVLISDAGEETVDLGSCTNNQDTSVVQTCRSPLVWNSAGAILAEYTTIRMCSYWEAGDMCVDMSLTKPVPSQPQVQWVYSVRTDYVSQQEHEPERWNVTLELSTSEFSSQFGASLDGCCLFYIDYETSFPQFDNYSQAIESELDHYCVASPPQNTTVLLDPRGVFDQKRAGQYMDIYYQCFNQFGSSVAHHDGYQLVLEAPPGQSSAQISRDSSTTVTVIFRPPQNLGEYLHPEDSVVFYDCSVWVVPGGSNMSNAKEQSTWHEIQKYSWQSYLQFPHMWQVYPSVDVYAQCNNRVGKGELLKQTLALTTYLTVNCLNPAYCPFVTQKSGRFSPYEVVQSIVLGAQLNISGNSTFADTLSFGLTEEVNYGSCDIVDGGCSLADTVNFTSMSTQLTQIYVSNPSDGTEYYYLLPVGSTPSQPQLDISLDAPSGVNSTISFTTSMYASEYSDDGQTNLTECLLVWNTDPEFNQYVADYRSMNSSNSFSFVPSHQGQQITLNFNDILPANMSGVTLHYYAQCYNLIGGSVLMVAYDLTAIPSIPEAPLSLNVEIGDWNYFYLSYAISSRSGNVGYKPVSSDYLEWNEVNVTMVGGYSGFNLSLGESNFTFVFAFDYQGTSRDFGFSQGNLPNFDLSWSPSWDFYLFVTNEFGTGEPLMFTQQFSFDPQNYEYSSPLVMSVDDNYYSQDTDFCRTCHFDPSEGNRYSHYDYVQNDYRHVMAYVYGTFHQRLQVIMTMNRATNYTLFDGFTNAYGYVNVNVSGLFNITNVTLGTEYQITAIGNSDLLTELSSFNLRIVNRAPIQTFMLYAGPNNDLSSSYCEMVTDTTSGLLISNDFYSESELFGCMLVWGPSSSLYEADDLPEQFNVTYNNARVAAGTGRFLLNDLESEASLRYFSFSEFVPNTTASAQDFHMACWNKYGKSRKASVYNVIAQASSSEVQTVSAVVDESDLTSLNVTVRLPLSTGDMGVLGIGSTVQFPACNFQWITNHVVVGSFHPVAMSDYVLTVNSELNFAATGLDLFAYPTVIFTTQCFGNMSGPGVSRNFTFAWQNPYSYSDVLVVAMEPQYAVNSIVQWFNFSNEQSTVVHTIIEGTLVNISVTYQPNSQLSFVDVDANSTVLSSCNTGLSGSCQFSFIMPASGSSITYRVDFNGTVYVNMSYLSVSAVPPQPQMSLVNDNSTMSLLLTVSEHYPMLNDSLVGCVLSAGTAASSFAGQTGTTYANAINASSTVFVFDGSNVDNIVSIDQRQLQAAHLMPGEMYHFYWVCYNKVGASAPAALFSVPAFNAPSSSSSSSTGAAASSSESSSVDASSSASYAVSSSSIQSDLAASSSALHVESSSAGQSAAANASVTADSSSGSMVLPSSSSSASLVVSSSGVSSTSAADISSSGVVASSSTAVSAGSSSSVMSGQSSTGSNGVQSSSVIRIVSSSSSAVAVVPDVPVGTVKVSFSVTLPTGQITVRFITALTNDILSTIARMFGLPVELIREFVQVTIGTDTVSSNRRLLDQSVPVSFTLLGNITTVTNNATIVEPGMTVDATRIATSLVGAIANGTLDSTESASLGMSVPLQPNLTVQQIVTPAESSSSTGVMEDSQDNGSSSLSDGGIAGAVIGSIVGAALLLAIAFAMYSGVLSSIFSRSPSVAQANANDIKATAKVEPRAVTVEMGVANKV